MSKDTIQLDTLNATEKFILSLIVEDDQYKPIGLERLTANYLSSIGVLEYSGGGRYKATDLGEQLHLERELFFNQQEESRNEVSDNNLVTTN